MKLALFAIIALIFCGCQSQAPTPDPRVSELETQVSTLKAQNAELQAQSADIARQRDTCAAKFSRSTILYDQGLFNTETRAWVIPVDVEPVLAPNKSGSYSHYDPKTQTETVHFRGKTAGN